MTLYENYSDPSPDIFDVAEWNKQHNDRVPVISALTHDCAQDKVPSCHNGTVDVLHSPKSGFCDGSIDLVIFMVSGPNMKQRRDLQRESFRIQTQNSSLSVRYLFAMGKPKELVTPFSLNQENIENKTKLRMIVQEAREHNDIVLFNIEEVYTNLVLKTIESMRWFNQTCQNAKYFMKTDDDMTINLKPLISHLHKINANTHRFLMGRCDLSGDIQSYSSR